MLIVVWSFCVKYNVNVIDISLDKFSDCQLVPAFGVPFGGDPIGFP